MMRRAFGFLVSIVLLASPLLGQEDEGSNSRAPERRALGREIVEGIVLGRDVEPLYTELEALGERESRRPPRELSRVGSELEAALAALRVQVRKAGRQELDLPALLAAHDQVRAADLLVRDHFRVTSARLTELGVGAEIHQRLASAEAAYLERIESLLGPLEEPLRSVREARKRSAEVDAEALTSALAGVAAFFDALEPPARPILGALPYRSLGLAGRPPKTEPAITPSYADPLAAPPGASEIEATAEAPLADEILELAASFGYDYVKIYEYVQQEIRTEWYAGSVKGALGTLRSGAGNDVDQASLLIALWRASRLPSRYVHGVIELPVEHFAAELGLTDPGDVAEALARAGVAHKPVIRGGRIAAFQLEHTWVAAYVPYSNYRGAVVDLSGPTWLPFAPAIERLTRTPSAGILRRMEYGVDGLVDRFLGEPQPAGVVETIRSEVEGYLAQEDPGATYEDQLGSVSAAEARLGLLPNSLPFPVVAVTGEEAALAAEHQVTVRFRVREGTGAQCTVILDQSFPLHEVLARRVTLSYLPATVDDHRTVNSFGGLSGVPAYLVRLRPQVKVGGRPAAVGEGSVEMGVAHRVEVEVSGPFGSAGLSQTVISGSYQAYGIGGQRTPREVPSPEDLADTERQAAELLGRVALELDERWGAAEDELSGLLDVAVVRPLPSVAAVADAVRVEDLLGQPFLLRWTGVTMDAALRVAEPIARGEDAAAARDWMRLAALEGSTLEHRVLEEVFLVESISADKGLALARAAAGEVLRLTDPADPRLGSLAHPAAVVEDVSRWLEAGLVVEIPAEPITLNAWTGSTWRVEDAETGAAGYFLSGGLAGAATSQPPGDWASEEVADALADPYGAKPNKDPLAGVTVRKLSGSDFQQAEVGSLLPIELTVKVLDKLERPVKGARVHFASSAVDGGLVEDGVTVSQVEVTTDSRGLASAPFRLGRFVDPQPVFLRSEGIPVRALRHFIEASADSEEGSLSVEAPFEAYGLPGAPVTFRRRDSSSTQFFGQPSAHVDTMTLVVEDRYGNPISNHAVQVEVTGSFRDEETCENPPPSVPRAATVYEHKSCPLTHPFLGECGASSVTAPSSPVGTVFGVILGNDLVTGYTVTASAEGLEPPLTFTYLPIFVEVTGFCAGSAKVWLRPPPDLTYQGVSQDAAHVGREALRKVEPRLFYWVPEVEIDENPPGHFEWLYHTAGTWQGTTGEVTFTIDHGGLVSEPSYLGSGVYQATVTAGGEPGVHEVEAQATDIQVSTRYLNPDTGQVEVRDEVLYNTTTGGKMAEIWALKPEIVAIDPSPIVLSDDSRTQEAITVSYRIEPLEFVPGQLALKLWAGDELVDVYVHPGHASQGSFKIPRGLKMDLNKVYELELLVNGASEAEVAADRVELPLAQRLIADYTKLLRVSQPVDLPNERACTEEDPGFFKYTLNQEARVTLAVRPIESLGPDLEPVLGPEKKLLDDVLREAKKHVEPITLDDLPQGDYEFELRATSTQDPNHEETRDGRARSLFSQGDYLPISHSLKQGVDLWSGQLTISRQDISIPGRGIALSFSRTYTSGSEAEMGGPLGVGWSHSYQSRLTVNPCGEVLIESGQGSGMRFAAGAGGTFQPLSGYHGTLLSGADESYDLYTKAGIRYHYEPGAGDAETGEPTEWLLASITDPSGNATKLYYDERDPDDPAKPLLLRAVEDSSGRRLSLFYEYREFDFWSGEVLRRVTGPGGIELTFTYDTRANLERAEREPHPTGLPSYVERYDYETPPGSPYELTQLLVASHDLVSQTTTSYGWERGDIAADQELTVGSMAVRTVTDPEEGVTTFDYGLLSQGRAGATTTVLDRRQKPTHTSFDRFGSPLSVTDPESHTSYMTWEPDRVLQQPTDARGVPTEYTHDEYGNVESETITVTDFDGVATTYTRTYTYYPPSAFDPPYIKDRVHTATDRNSTTTTYKYDTKGRLTEQSVQVTGLDGIVQALTTIHGYYPNGDRWFTINPRHKKTWFEYDIYGNLKKTTDPLLHETTTKYDARSRAYERTDARQHTTKIYYDSLDRVVRRVYPDAVASEERIDYDDAGRQKTEIDAEEHETTTTYDRDGRPVWIENAEGGTRELRYDKEGNKELESTWFDPLTQRHDTIFTYDEAGRLKTRTEPLGRLTTYDYDEVGNVLRETLTDTTNDGFVARITETDYDELSRAIRIRRRLKKDGEWVWLTAKIKYDGEGRKVLEVDPLGREASYLYDEIGRLLQTTEPEWTEDRPRVTQNAYDENGNLVKTTLKNDSFDQVRELRYDDADRLEARGDTFGRESILKYDENGNLKLEIDRLLNTVEHDYDERNRRTKTTVYLDRVTLPEREVVTTFVYDRVGNLREEHWANGNVVVHDYDRLNRLKSTVDNLGPIVAYVYDARGNRKYEYDGRNSETLNVYDALNRLRRQDLPEDRSVSFTYDVAGDPLTRTNSRGHTTVMEYDELNRLVKVTDPAPFRYETAYTYDDVGNKLTETDRRGYTTTFEYDDLNRLRFQLYPPLEDGTVYTMEWTYDAAGNLRTELDRRGILTEHTYDTENLRRSTTRAGLLIEEREYDKEGRLQFLTDAKRITTGYEYEERGLLTAENRPLAAITRYSYDDMGDRVYARDPEGRMVRWSYDDRRRQETETQELGDGKTATTTYGYDGNGNRASKERPEKNTWIYDYDKANRLKSVTDDEGGVTTYDYDKNGNLRFYYDGEKNPTEYRYDELDRRTELIYADAATEVTTYDENGNVLTHQDAKEQVTTYEYDPLNRRTSATYPPDPETDDDLQSIVYVFDANNNLRRVTEKFQQSGPQVTIRTYDDFDRLETVTDRWKNKLTYIYDANGNRTHLTDPQAKTTIYTYDDLNRMETVTTAAGVTEYIYYRNSRLKEIRYPNGTKASYVYDQANRVHQIENRHNTALVSRFEYDYDLNGNRIEQIEEHSGLASETTTYSYDLADRLLEVYYPEKTTIYTYDDAGNRETEQEWDPQDVLITDKVYTYSKRNELEYLEDLLDPSRSVTYGYDPNGNQIQRSRSSKSSTFTFDVLDRMIEVTKDGSVVGSYAYDFQGLRVEKVTEKGTAQYVYDQQSVLTRSDGDGSAKFEYGPDRLLSVDDPTEGRAFYLFDALRSVTNLTTPQGTLLARYQWDAWGNLRAALETGANPFGFTGHEHDRESGLVYAKARFYDPQTGLFLSRDPVDGEMVNPPSLHRYLYAFQNPTIYIDPDGRHPALEDIEKKVRDLADDPDRIRDYLSTFMDEEDLTIWDLSVAGGLLDKTGDALGAGNAMVNLIWMISARPKDWESLPPEIRSRFEQELQDDALSFFKTYLGLEAAGRYILEAPREAGVAIVGFVKKEGRAGFDFLVRAANGDRRAQFELGKFVTGAAVDVMALALTEGESAVQVATREEGLFGRLLAMLRRFGQRLDKPKPGGIVLNLIDDTAEGALLAERLGSAVEADSTSVLLSEASAVGTRLGVARKNPADWRALRDLWDELGLQEVLSKGNREKIARGRTPIVDEEWIRYFPEDAGLVGERIPMHHIQGYPITVPLPATRHLDAHSPGGFRHNPGGPGSALPAYPAKKGD